MPTKETTGFIDAHVHLTGPAGLEQLVAAGIRAARDAGTKDGAGLAVRRQSGSVTILSAGRALFRRGGYGVRFGIGADTKSEIKTAIAGMKQAGADIIKAMASGMVSFRKPGTITPGGFTEDELRVVVREAEAVGLAVMAHANGEQAIRAAAGAGVRSIEHGFFMSASSLDLLAKNGVYWVPTVGALDRAVRAQKASDEVRSFIAGLIKDHLAMIAEAWRRRVPLAIGTDAVLPDDRYRECYEEELAWFERAGIARSDVETIAREGGARLLEITR